MAGRDLPKRLLFFFFVVTSIAGYAEVRHRFSVGFFSVGYGWGQDEIGAIGRIDAGHYQFKHQETGLALAVAAYSYTGNFEDNPWHSALPLTLSFSPFNSALVARPLEIVDFSVYSRLDFPFRDTFIDTLSNPYLEMGLGVDFRVPNKESPVEWGSLFHVGASYILPQRAFAISAQVDLVALTVVILTVIAHVKHSEAVEAYEKYETY